MNFTAAELEAAIEVRENHESWYDIQYAYGPNPNLNEEKAAEAERLYRVWLDDPERLKIPHHDNAKYAAYTAYRKANKGSLETLVPVPPTVEVNGVEYTIKEIVSDRVNDDQWIVIEVDGRLFRKDGFYSSYGGDSWDGDFREVTAQTKTVTVYR